MKSLLTRFVRDQSAVTSIEYALVISLVSVALIVGASSAGLTINNVFAAVATKLVAP